MRTTLPLGLSLLVSVLSACAGPVCEPGDLCPWMGDGSPGIAEAGAHRLDSRLYSPMDLAFAPDGERAVVVDWNNHRLLSIDGDGLVAALVGAAGRPGEGPEGPAEAARVRHPTDVAFRPDGSLVIAAWRNWKIAEVDPDGVFRFTCGTGERDFHGDGGPAAEAALDLPSSVVALADGRVLIGDQANQRVRVVDGDGTIDTLVGDGRHGYGGDGGPATEASLAAPAFQQTTPALKLAARDGLLYIADTHNGRVRRVDLETGLVDTLAGVGRTALDSGPADACEAGCGYAGDGGPADEAELTSPTDVAVASDGTVYIADPELHCVRAVTPDGVIDTVAGICGERGEEPELEDYLPAREARLNGPFGVALDAEDRLYIAEPWSHAIRRVEAD